MSEENDQSIRSISEGSWDVRRVPYFQRHAGQGTVAGKLDSRHAGVHKGFAESAHQNMASPSRWVGNWLAESSVDERGQTEVTLDPQWPHTLLASSGVWHEILVLASVIKLQETARSQDGGKTGNTHTLLFCRDECYRNSPECVSSRSGRRLRRRLFLFLFVSLFLWELSQVSEAEQKHTNRMARNDKNLSILQEPAQISPFLIISLSLFLRHM